ncbi:uncharacterized protein LOC130666449 [Microplitis mediator]|uniref:uncharacterized protein LOC130666449 n=1 Tax=Microplitis mediator TaxID=375433 RepID=UPI00255607C7|nr:uncharacterized protein LOC130666449 [Microplitis mediator]
MGCPSISIIKILQLIVVCCVLGLDVLTKNYLKPKNSSNILNDLVSEAQNNTLTIPYLNIKINAESIPTQYIATGTVVAYLIIIFVSLISGTFASPLTRLTNVTFCLIGTFLFLLSGSLLINDFRVITFESIKTSFEKSLQDARSFNIAKGSLCILESCLLLLDALSSFFLFL